MKYKIIISSIILLLISAVIVSAASFSELNSNQKQYYWSCLKDSSQGKSCINLLTEKKYSLYKDCSLNCISKAAVYKPRQRTQPPKEDPKPQDPAPQPSTFKEHHLTIQNKDRTYLIYEPSKCKTQTCPLLIMFHGLGGNAQSASSDTYGWKNTADINNFIVAFPESLTLPAKSIFGYTDPAGKHWDIVPVMFSYTQDVEFADKMISAIDLEYDVDNNKVFATGHSYGGYFSYYLTFALPTKIKAFGSHSAGVIAFNVFGTNILWPAEPLSASSSGKKAGMIIYSNDDTTSPPANSKTLGTALSNKGHLVEMIELNGMGHQWDKTKNQNQWIFFVKNS